MKCLIYANFFFPMTGNGVMHNGTTIIEQYGQNLDRLQVGDRVGVVRRDDGTLHFFVNGIDQGAAAEKVPEKVYGVIDLYGQAGENKHDINVRNLFNSFYLKLKQVLLMSLNARRPMTRLTQRSQTQLCSALSQSYDFIRFTEEMLVYRITFSLPVDRKLLQSSMIQLYLAIVL